MNSDEILLRQGLIRTKYTKPGISPNLIPRRHIEDKLDCALNYKLTVITAPAGYGKSSAVLKWLDERGLPSAWYSIGENDNDPVRFWRYVMAAICSGGFIQQKNTFEDMPLSKELILSDIFIDILVDKISDITRNIILVLDDYHLIHNMLIKKSFEYFIKRMPSNINIILLSRKLPESGLEIYAQGQVFRLNSKDLAFNTEEISKFFSVKGLRLTNKEISELENYTEGWAAGLVVAAISLEEGIDVRAAISGFCGSSRHIETFLSYEVFDRWPEDIKNFLIYTSFLERLCGSLCSKVAGNKNSSKLLRMLAENNSFIIPLDGEYKWYRYHHLFQEFLKNRLEYLDISIKLSLYRLAGEWYMENGYIEEAIPYLIEAGDYEKAYPLLLDIYYTMNQISEIPLWVTWMDSIPEKYYADNVRVYTGYSWIFTMEGLPEKAELWADKAKACFERIKEGLDKKEKDYLEAHIAATYANVAVYRMDVAKAMSYYKKVYKYELYTPITIGEMNSGEPSLIKTTYGFKGRLNKINEAYGGAIDFSRLIGDYSVYFAITFAECNYERNNLKAVNVALINHMGKITRLKHGGIIVPCFITMAKYRKAMGDFNGALQAVDSGRNLIEGAGKSFWNYYLDLFTASLYISAGDTADALKWIDADRIDIYGNISAAREFEYIVLSRYLLLTNQLENALLLLNRLEDFARKQDRLGSLIEILCLTAIDYNKQGNVTEAMHVLHRTLELGMEEGYVRTFVDETQQMAELLTKYKSWARQMSEQKCLNYAKDLLVRTKEFISLRNNLAVSDQTEIKESDTDEFTLSARELDVIKLMAAEYSNQEIADKLFITIRTVKYHNARIFEKLKVKNRLQVIIKAKQKGLIDN